MKPKNFLILTEKGLEFVKTWFNKDRRVPPELTRMYQMLLHICCFGGSIKYEALKEIGYEKSTLSKALGEEFVVALEDQSKLEDKVKAEIARIVDTHPKSIYT